MPFKKGERKGHKKAGGRQKGTPNKKTEIANAIIDRVLENGNKGLDDIWNGLKPKEQMEFIIKFMPFKLPQMARIENENKAPQNITINMIAATKENVKQIENNLTQDIEYEEIDD